MFTGIVDHCGEITAVSSTSNSIRLSIATQFSDLILGESICVDGICLTVTRIHNHSFDCDLSPETLQLTTAKNYLIGRHVNVERAMQLSDRLNGHIVTGHVDGVITIKKIKKQNDFYLCEFVDIQKQHELLLTTKGSVCINGVSLTINSLGEKSFSVMLIPHTWQRTNLNRLTENDVVHVEYDYLAKLISRRDAIHRVPSVGA